jgi:HK97 family phage major capsid protein
MPHPLNFSGIIPAEFSTQIIEEAIQQSAALQLGQRLPMGTRVTDLPIPQTLPTATWTGVPPPTGEKTGLPKTWTDVMLTTQSVKAEEVAAVTAIPDAYLDDSEINIWAWVRPRLAEAIAIALDNAVFYGLNCPASFPAGGLLAAAYSLPVDPDDCIDAVDAVNKAMGLVEAQGVAVNGHASDLLGKSMFRGVRDANGALLLGEGQVNNQQRPTLYGLPISYNPWSQVTTADFITGGWQNLIIGVRQDIRYNLDPSGVIINPATGTVLVSGFQHNTTPLKVWARFGVTIVKPVTPRIPGGATPFAKVRLAGITSGAPLEGEGARTTAAKK